MDWNQSTMYEQRVRFILEVQQRTFSFAESCRRYGISRTAGYTWWTRFLAEGFEGLHDRSHRPHHCPHAVAEPIVEHVVDLRQRYGWGLMREDIAGPQGASSRPMWETLEGMVREKAQEFIQQIMEEEVTELLATVCELKL